jgi:Tat protein secretion system quality control protein TatD with DNase activity
MWNSSADALQRLADALGAARDDPHLVAVGEIGLDFFVAGLDPTNVPASTPAQLKLARDAGLPVILHVRRRWTRCWLCCAVRRWRRHRPCLQRQPAAGRRFPRTWASNWASAAR